MLCGTHPEHRYLCRWSYCNSQRNVLHNIWLEKRTSQIILLRHIKGQALTSLSFMANMMAPACSAAFPTIGSRITLMNATGMFMATDAPWNCYEIYCINFQIVAWMWELSSKQRKKRNRQQPEEKIRFIILIGCINAHITSIALTKYSERTEIQMVKIDSQTMDSHMEISGSSSSSEFPSVSTYCMPIIRIKPPKNNFFLTKRKYKQVNSIM